MSEQFPDATDRDVLLTLTVLDAETAAWSGGFEHHAYYKHILQYNEAALAGLVAVCRQQEQVSWAALQLTWTIAAAVGKSIPFTPEDAGRHGAVVERIVAWGDEQGYTDYYE